MQSFLIRYRLHWLYDIPIKSQPEVFHPFGCFFARQCLVTQPIYCYLRQLSASLVCGDCFYLYAS